MPLIKKSETLTLTMGSTRAVPLIFLSKTGPRGDRLEILRTIVQVDVQVDTDGASSFTTGGWATFLARLRMFDAQGDLVNLTGPEVRMVHFAEAGRKAVADPATLAVSQSNATRTIYFVIDHAPRKARRRYDFALAASSLLSGGGLELTTPAASAVGTGAGVTVDSITATVYFECREASGVESHARRELRSHVQSGTLDLRMPVFGGAVRGAYIFKGAEATTGGTDLSSITQVTIDSVGLNQIPADILRESYIETADVDRASTADPFVQTTERVIPLIWPAGDHKIPEMPIHTGEMLVRLAANSVSNVSIVTDIVTDGTSLSRAADSADAVAVGANRVYAKTAGKTKRGIGDWGPYAAKMPRKAAR